MSFFIPLYKLWYVITTRYIVSSIYPWPLVADVRLDAKGVLSEELAIYRWNKGIRDMVLGPDDERIGTRQQVAG